MFASTVTFCFSFFLIIDLNLVRRFGCLPRFCFCKFQSCAFRSWHSFPRIPVLQFPVLFLPRAATATCSAAVKSRLSSRVPTPSGHVWVHCILAANSATMNLTKCFESPDCSRSSLEYTTSSSSVGYNYNTAESYTNDSLHDCSNIKVVRVIRVIAMKLITRPPSTKNAFKTRNPGICYRKCCPLNKRPRTLYSLGYLPLGMCHILNFIFVLSLSTVYVYLIHFVLFRFLF